MWKMAFLVFGIINNTTIPTITTKSIATTTTKNVMKGSFWYNPGVVEIGLSVPTDPQLTLLPINNEPVAPFADLE